MRRWDLQHYGFACTCPACTSPDTPGTFGNASRDRRWKLRELDSQLRLVSNDKEGLQVRLEMVAVMLEEGFVLPVMGQLYLEIARICARNGDVGMAVRAARRGEGVYRVCLGCENEKTVDARKSVRAFEKQLPGVGVAVTKKYK
jgi:hypothetical protein